MKAYIQFTHEINRLLAFYKATIYAYEQTDELLWKWRKNKSEFIELGLNVKQPTFYKHKKRAKIENRKNLSETVYVRIVSALEVFLVDLIRDIFIDTKEPFKKQDIMIQFTQAELLSIHSPADIFNKIINKECRKLTSGGFNDIIKYYKKHFDIDLSSFAPGKSKMEEYHERRHILVHRLGRTDQQYRVKYKTKSQTISIDETYLIDCVKDFKDFSELVFTQVKYKLKNGLKSDKIKEKIVEAKNKITIEILKDEIKYFEPNFEFWGGDEFSMFSNILDTKRQIETNKFEIQISGTERQINAFIRIIKKGVIHKQIKAEFHKYRVPKPETISEPRFLDEKIILTIKEKLPPQPWETGVHKKVASELGISNKLVSIAIQQLIGKGVFKNQIDGIIIDEPQSDEENKTKETDS
ncbi:hypothetical protein [Flavobacterium aquiphilum]|uniref:hypothetical protein n=1 Tax=Flavobacterium aquiphilum TaxID=3003261 RepID=UPI00247FE26C|nr:hypothetical protein [Flavobacterium aquiphilum]